MQVLRLKNAPNGQPYSLEKIAGVDKSAAYEAVGRWWESGGTLAIVVLGDGGVELSRYERDYFDPQRAPDDWVKRKRRKKITKPTPLPKRPKPQAPPPTLFNEPVQTQRRVTCGVCDRRVKAQRKNPAPEEAAVCNGCGVPFMCHTCMGMIPKSRQFPGDDDPTPSGRLSARRCPECGRPVKAKQRDIEEAYLRRR